MEARTQPQATNGAAIAALVGGILAVLLVLAAGLFEGSPVQGVVAAGITIAITFPAFVRAKTTGVGFGMTVAGMGLAGAALLLPLGAIAMGTFGQG